MRIFENQLENLPKLLKNANRSYKSNFACNKTTSNCIWCKEKR